jgi:DNA replication ATP-dependent helicase Dna2
MRPTQTSSTSRSNAAQFVERLRRFVLDERDAQRQQIEQEWAKPLAERVADGLAIESVCFLGMQPDGYLELACDRNQSRFREGDTLCLNRGSPFFEPFFNVTLEVDDETRLTVFLDDPKTFDLSLLHSEPTGWVLDQGYLDLSHYVLDALAEAGDTLIGVQRILPLLMSVARPQADMACYQRALERAESLGLNYDQSEAFARAGASGRDVGRGWRARAHHRLHPPRHQQRSQHSG